MMSTQFARLVGVAVALVVGLASISGAPASAQPSASVEMHVEPARVEVGQAFALRIDASARGASLGEVRIPDLTSFEELSRQQQNSFSFGFGSGAQSAPRKTILLQLRALRAGTYRISPATAVVQGETIRSAALTLTVLSAGASTPSSVTPNDGASTDGSADDALSTPSNTQVSGARVDAQAFLRTIVDPPSPYVGQQATITVLLYSRIRNVESTASITPPDATGFWTQELDTRNVPATVANVGDVAYRVHTIQRFAAFPLHVGVTQVSAPALRLVVSGRDFFDPGQLLELKGVPVEVRVRDLPAPKPSAQDGIATGAFTIEASLSPNSIETGNAVTYRVAVEGTGSTASLRLSNPVVPHARVLEPALRDETRVVGASVLGKRTWEWIIVPELPGHYTIEPIALKFFDPALMQYESATAPSFTFDATGEPIVSGPTPSAPSSPGSASTSSEARPNLSVGPVRRDAKLRAESTPLYVAHWYRVALLIPPVLFAFALLVASARQRTSRRNAAPHAEALRALDDAHNAARSHDAHAFYGNVSRAISITLASALNRPVLGWTNAQLRSELATEGFDPSLIDRLCSELEGAEFARFAAAGGDRDEMKRCEDRARTLVRRVFDLTERHHQQVNIAMEGER